MVISEFYAYDTLLGYVTSDSLRPGCGYWVRASECGKLVLSTGLSPEPGVTIRPTTEMPPSPPSRGAGVDDIIPTAFALYQNSPNPFNPSTMIAFDLPREETVTLRIYGLLGQVVRSVMDGIMLRAGRHTIRFDGLELPSGVYFYQLTAGDYMSVRKMILSR